MIFKKSGWVVFLSGPEPLLPICNSGKRAPFYGQKKDILLLRNLKRKTEMDRQEVFALTYTYNEDGEILQPLDKV